MDVITPEILLQAYAAGVFPMAESADDDTIHWIEPETRGILPLDKFHASKSLRHAVRHAGFEVRIDTAFPEVMQACAARAETWINGRIFKLYVELHARGHCHSVECWRGGELLGGLYGLHIGSAFFGESMFSRATNASKVALVHLVARLKFGGFTLLDAQFVNDHLLQFGCEAFAKKDYRKLLKAALVREAKFSTFEGNADPEAVLNLMI